MDSADTTQKIICDKIEQYACNKINSVLASGFSQGQNIAPDNEEIFSADISNQNLNQALEYLNRVNRIQTLSSIRTIDTKKKGIIARAVVLSKKIIRKIVKWYVESVCVAQTQFNHNSVEFDSAIFNQVNNITGQLELQKQINDEQVAYRQKFEAQKSDLESARLAYESRMTSIDERFQCLQLQRQEYERMLQQSNAVITKLEEEISTIRRKVPEIFETNSALDSTEKVTVAQSGEDSIIAYLFAMLKIDYKTEKYLDLGANHAKFLSNTYMLYRQGMRGVLVEANPQLIDELKFYRGEDLVLNKCISNVDGEIIKFYILNGDGLSSMDIESVNEVIAVNPDLKLEKEIEIEGITVNHILQQYFDRPPLVLNVDVEGMESDILANYDYEHYAPFIIVVERIDYSTTIATKKRKDKIDELMAENGYFEYAYTGINSIFVNEKMVEFFRNKGENA